VHATPTKPGREPVGLGHVRQAGGDQSISLLLFRSAAFDASNLGKPVVAQAPGQVAVGCGRWMAAEILAAALAASLLATLQAASS